MVELDQVEKVTTPRSSRFAVQSGLIAWIVPGDVEETPPACIPAEVIDISHPAFAFARNARSRTWRLAA